MKNDDEMYRSVLSRREEYRKKKEKRICTVRRTVPVLACFCFAVVFGLMFWDDLAKLHSIPIHPDIVEESMIETSESTAAADTTESSSTDQAIINDAVSTTISAQNSETDMVAATVPPQMQTVATAVSSEESGRETEHEIIEHTETQAHVEDKKPNTDVQTTSPVTYTQPVITVQTTPPAQTTVEITTSIVIKPEPSTNETTKPPDNSQDSVNSPSPPIPTEPSDMAQEEPVAPDIAQEPVALPAQPIPFDDIADVADAIQNNDVSSYPEYDRGAYLSMFERIRNDNFVYQVSDNELISLRKDLGIYLFPYATNKDIGIGYYVTYKRKLYHVMFCYADPYVISRTDGIAEYLKKRMGRRSDKEIIIQNQTVSELIRNDSSICASSFIDSNHYYDIVTSASEDDVKEFLSIFSYEKIQL